MIRYRYAVFLLAAAAVKAQAQAPPDITLHITLNDALSRAKQYGNQIQSASLTAALAKEDTVQAKAAALPSVNAFNQFIYTQGNGTPSGVFVANDGVHIYNEQAVVHQELLALIRHGEINRARAAEAVAKAKIEVARRGLNSTVVQDYYAILAAQRKTVNAQTAVREGERFLDITKKLEAGGEVAHSDVIKAQLTLQQRQRDLQDAQLAVEKARMTLGVLIFPDFRSDFTVEDDLATPALLPPAPEIQAKALSTSPDISAAKAGMEVARHDVNVAKYAYLPSFGLDFFYGLDSNQFLARTPNPELPHGYRQNLGYSAQATLNIPVWNWGATRSKILQAQLKAQQAQLDLSLAQRTLAGNLAQYYREAQAAQEQADSLNTSTVLSVESLRLTILRYQAGEATVLEVVDAQTTLTQARNAQEDGLVRYRTALANLQSLTGTF
jgi:outer membrane protein TolC